MMKLVVAEDIYSLKQVKADIAFVEYQCKNNQVVLREGTGIAKLISDCESAIKLNDGSKRDTNALAVMYSVSEVLRTLWLRNVIFTNQLRAMNTGNFAYGNPDAVHDHYFKDFEFELFSTAQLAMSGSLVELPQHTVGEDIECGNIQIQCKHPSTLNQVDKLIREFTARLNKTGEYGIFGMAVEDCLGYPSGREFETVDAFNAFMASFNLGVEKSLNKLYAERLAKSTRVLGLYTSASFFLKIKDSPARMVRMANAVFCFRVDRKEIKEEHYKKAYQLLSVFNPRPSWLTIEKQALR